MRAFTPIAALVSLAAFAAAIRNPDNPQDPINCPPSGGADKCSKETSVGVLWQFPYSLPYLPSSSSSLPLFLLPLSTSIGRR